MSIKVLLVGAGRMGRNHLRVLRENPRFEVVGVVDSNIGAALEAGKGDEEWHDSVRNVSYDYDCAIIATPSTVRRDVFAQLNSVPILCEKPLALSYEDAAFLRDNVRSLVVGHIERFNPAVKKLKELIDNDLVEFRLQTSLTTARFGSPAPSAADRGDIVFDLAVHDIDICRWLFGPLRLSAVQALTKGCAALDFDTQSPSAPDLISVRVGWSVGAKTRSMTARTTRGGLKLDYINQTLSIDDNEIRIERDEPLRAELDAFATFVETGGEVRGGLCSAEDAAAAVKLCEQACEPERGFV